MRSQTAGRPRNRRALPKLSLSILALPLGLLALAGCGSSSSSTSSTTSTPAAPAAPATTSSATSSTPAATAQSLSLSANAEGLLKFDTTSLSAKAGKVTIAFSNPASLEHNVTVSSPSGAVVGATPTFHGGSKSVTVNLTPGSYKFYCSVPGHRQAGMEGTLVVK